MAGLQSKSVPHPLVLGSTAPRCGLSAPEVLVVLVIVFFIALFVLMGLTRQRESARFAGCQRNLMQIGAAVALYDQSAGHLPEVPDLARADRQATSAPLKALLEELGVPDLSGLTSEKKRPPRVPNLIIEERRIPGFLCGSDLNATGGPFPAPVSYRATTGDGPDRGNGGFAPGRRINLADIENRDGTGFTAAFAERLVGDSRDHTKAPMNYTAVSGPVSSGGCPSVDLTAWRGDAGSSWAVAGWATTLYNHALTPNASPSCVDADGRTALMGASSGHVRGVNVLLFDGSVRTFTPQVDPNIWRGWATIGEPPASSP